MEKREHLPEDPGPEKQVVRDPGGQDGLRGPSLRAPTPQDLDRDLEQDRDLERDLNLGLNLG